MVKRLAQTEQPAIVIAASGMCQGGRIVNYLEVLFVDYQAKGTLGRKLLQARRGERVQVNGRTIDLRAECFSVIGFSAHADQQDLLGFIEGMASKPREIRLVHGDAGAKSVFGDLVRRRWPGVFLVVA